MGIVDENPKRVRRFRDGDPEILEAVYRANFDAVLGIARHGFAVRGGSVSSAPPLPARDAQLDFVHDVFVRAFSKRARYNYNALRPHEPYLLQIARNLRIEWPRASGRLEIESADDVQASLHDGEEGTHEGQIWTKRRAATQSYLEPLPAEQQQFVQLRFEAGLSQAEVAQRMQGLHSFLQSQRLFDGADRPSRSPKTNNEQPARAPCT